MSRKSKWTKRVSSALMGSAAAMLLLGILLTPNIILADEDPIDPNGYAPCGGCLGTCQGSAAPCPLQKTCNADPNIASSCKNISGGTCQCGLRSGDPTRCDCK